MSKSDASLSTRARGKLNVLEEARRKWDHVHALVQQIHDQRSLMSMQKRRVLASVKDPLRGLMRQLARSSSDVGQMLSDRGFAMLGEDVMQLTALTRLAGTVKAPTVFRMQELVGLVYEGIELARHRVRQEDADEDLIRRAT